MSIYSGFATKKQEKNYNKCIEALLVVLFKRISKIYTKEDCDEDQFKSYLLRILSCMFDLESHKYQNPKYSKRSEFLCNLLNIYYKSTLNLKKDENIKSKQENLQQFNIKVRHHNFRIQSNKLSSSKTFNTLDNSSSYQTTIIHGDEDAGNNNSFQRGPSRNEKKPIIQYQNNSILQVKTIKDQGTKRQLRGESVNGQYKERICQSNRPKSSQSFSGTINQCQKISSNNSLNIQMNEKQMTKKKKYQDYLEKYYENYFMDQLDKNINCQNILCQEDDLKATTKKLIEIEYSDDSINGEYNIQDEEQLLKNIENIKKEQDQQIPIDFIIQQQQRSQQSHQSKNKNYQTLSQQYSNQLLSIKSLLSQPQQSQYSIQSQQVQQQQSSTYSKQCKQQQQQDMQQIQMQLNQQHLIKQQEGQLELQKSQCSSLISKIQIDQQQQSQNLKQSCKLKTCQEQNQLGKDALNKDISQIEKQISRKYIKQNSDFLNYNEFEEQELIENRQKLQVGNKQSYKVQKQNKQLTQSQSYENNNQFKQTKQSYELQNNSCVFSKEKSNTTLTKEQDDEVTQDTAEFKDLKSLNNSIYNPKIKELKSDQNINSLKLQQTGSLNLQQPIFSISVDGEDGKNQNLSRNFQLITENALYLNANNPRKKSIGDMVECQIKVKSPQFYESQINAIKQQLSMQSTYLQIQQKQLDEKLQEQQQQKEKELQQNQIDEQFIIKRETNSVNNQAMQKEKCQSSQENQNSSHLELIKVAQEEDEDESIYKESNTSYNKIEQIQKRQLNKENQIQSSEESISKVLIAEKIGLKLNDININQNINLLKNQQTQLQDVIQSHHIKLKNQNINGNKSQNDESQNNLDKMEKDSYINQDNNNQLQQSQIKKRIKILQQNEKQKALQDIQNKHKNSIRTVSVKENIMQDSNQKIDKQQQIDKTTMDKETIEEYQYQNHDRQSAFSPNLQKNECKGINMKKSSLQPIIPKICQQNRILTEIPTNNMKNNYPQNHSTKRNKIQEDTNQSPNKSQNEYFQQSPKQKTITNEFSQSQKRQFKISKNKNLQQTIREQFADTIIKEISTDIYINNSNINTKKNDQQTPFWAQQNNQKLQQSQSKENIEEKNSNNNYSFYNSIQNSQNTLGQLDQNIMLSKIINCPLNPQYLNKLQMQYKSRNQTLSPKNNVRSQSSTSGSYKSYHIKQTDENNPFMIQASSRISSLTNSPNQSTTNKNQQIKEQISVKDSFLTF